MNEKRRSAVLLHAGKIPAYQTSAPTRRRLAM